MERKAETSPSHPTARASSGGMKYSRRRVSATVSLTQIERVSRKCRRFAADAEGQSRSRRETSHDSAVRFKNKLLGQIRWKLDQLKVQFVIYCLIDNFEIDLRLTSCP